VLLLDHELLELELMLHLIVMDVDFSQEVFVLLPLLNEGIGTRVVQHLVILMVVVEVSAALVVVIVIVAVVVVIASAARNYCYSENALS
jgi:hypothetical protein